MNVEGLHRSIQVECQPAPWDTGHMDTVDAAMISMSNHWKTISFKFRPLTPPSDLSEDDSLPPSSAELKHSLMVNNP